MGSFAILHCDPTSEQCARLTGGRRTRLTLIRVGRHGIDRYSTCLDPEVGLGVGGLQVMEKSYDLDNLETFSRKYKMQKVV